MAAKNCVLGTTLSYPPYVRSAQGRFPYKKLRSPKLRQPNKSAHIKQGLLVEQKNVGRLDNTHTDMATYRLNQPRGWYSEYAT